MLLSFNIANHFRSNPLVYLNDLRINGDLSFFKENQANFNDKDELNVYLKNIDCNNDDTYVLYESHFNYLKEQGNELLTKTHKSFLSKENLISKQVFIEKIICQIVYVKKI